MRHQEALDPTVDLYQQLFEGFKEAFKNYKDLRFTFRVKHIGNGTKENPSVLKLDVVQPFIIPFHFCVIGKRITKVAYPKDVAPKLTELQRQYKSSLQSFETSELPLLFSILKTLCEESFPSLEIKTLLKTR